MPQLSDERTKVEELYFRYRAECTSALNMLDDSRIKAEEKDKLLVALKNEKNTELSDKLIHMSEILQKSKLE